MSISIISPDGTITQPTNEDREKFAADIDFRSQWMRMQVGGWIEVVRLHPAPPKDPRAIQMIVNEEGLLYQLPTNYLGTMLYSALCRGENTTPIAGTVIILTGEDTLD